MKSVAILSHRFGNIGHNFMALGVEEIAKEAFGQDTSFTHFEQHHPFSVYPNGSLIKIIDKFPHHRFLKLRSYLGTEKSCNAYWPSTSPLNFDLAVSSGGPNLVQGGADSPQHRLMLHHFYGAFHFRGVPLIDGGVGSGFPLERIPNGLNEKDTAFFQRAASFTKAITVREHVAQNIYKSIGVDTTLLPCMAIASGRYFEKFRQNNQWRQKGAIAINFQAKGSNEDWGQNVDPVAWMKLVRQVIDVLSSDHKIIIICHSKAEKLLAQELAPELPIYFPQTELEYADIIANVKVGFVSRIHAGIAMAGIGIPSIVAGNDTRIGTTNYVGLESKFTKEITAEWVIESLHKLMRNIDSESDKLIAVREKAIADHANIYRKASK